MIFVIIILVVLLVLWLNKTKRLCKHKWIMFKEYSIPDEKGRPQCFRFVTILECPRCNKFIVAVSHMCS